MEAGITELFQSGRFADYLSTMSKFHHYSFGNILLIAMQFPGATNVAGYNDWKKKFGRHVKVKETGIKILAPCSFKAMMEVEKIDPATHCPILDGNGQPVTERIPIGANRFKVVTVFDVSQTEGKELPAIVEELTGDVAQYAAITGKLEKLSPLPIVFDEVPGTAKGYCSAAEGRIVIRPGMSEAQTLKTMIHEVAHAKLHTTLEDGAVSPDEQKKDRNTREVEAESVAYVVCQHFGVDTSDYTFGYVAGWSKGKGLPELRASLDCIRSTAAELIDGIEGRHRELPPPTRETARRRSAHRKSKAKPAQAAR